MEGVSCARKLHAVDTRFVLLGVPAFAAVHSVPYFTMVAPVGIVKLGYGTTKTCIVKVSTVDPARKVGLVLRPACCEL